jgi:hypothetical protein
MATPLEKSLASAFGDSRSSSTTPAYTPIYGRKEYEDALRNWQGGINNYSSMMQAALSPLQQNMQYYQPGSGYGQGQRQQAQENVQQGVSQDLGSMVASGMSSMAGARGVGTRAGSELSKLYSNIEDTRAGLLNQITGNYAQTYASMLGGYGNMYNNQPNYGQYVKVGQTIPSQTTYF